MQVTFTDKQVGDILYASDINQIKAAVNANITHTHPATDITPDSTHRFVTDAEKNSWNSKATNLDSITDVVITNPSNGQVIKFNGTNWINAADSVGTGGGGGELPEFSFYYNETIRPATSPTIGNEAGTAGNPLGVTPSVRKKDIAATSYTLSPNDNGWTLRFTSNSPVTVHVPINLEYVLIDNTVTTEFFAFNVQIQQAGLGQVTLSPDTNVTINNRLFYTKTSGRYAKAFLEADGTNTFISGGDMT